MRYPSLDSRLQTVAEMFDTCETGADIGADHGRLSCYLLHQNICKRMLVTDISGESLKKAQKLLRLHKLEDRSDFVVADGLEAVSSRADCIAICGMGGRVMSGILLRGEERLQNAPLVMSCHTDIPLLRKTLAQIKYRIVEERIARDNGRFYIIMRAEPGDMVLTEKEAYLGPVLMKKKDSVLLFRV